MSRSRCELRAKRLRACLLRVSLCISVPCFSPKDPSRHQAIDLPTTPQGSLPVTALHHLQTAAQQQHHYARVRAEPKFCHTGIDQVATLVNTPLHIFSNTEGSR
jgi:hypothetical protein